MKNNTKIKIFVDSCPENIYSSFDIIKKCMFHSIQFHVRYTLFYFTNDKNSKNFV